jgi:hypothetical protein
MSRDWLAVYPSLRDKPNYRRMTPAGRGCLLHVWMLGSSLGPDRAEATWPNREELLDVLELDGFLASHLDELFRYHWLVEEDGAVVIRDWDKYQWAASQAIARAFEAERLRKWRKHRSAEKEGSQTLQEKETTRHYITDVRTRTDAVRTLSTGTNGKRCRGDIGREMGRPRPEERWNGGGLGEL